MLLQVVGCVILHYEFFSLCRVDSDCIVTSESVHNTAFAASETNELPLDVLESCMSTALSINFFRGSGAGLEFTAGFEVVLNLRLFLEMRRSPRKVRNFSTNQSSIWRKSIIS